MSNDRIILGEILTQLRAERAPERSESAFFELFVAEQVLKDFDFSDDEVESGLVGDGQDGGIDAMHLLVNGELVQDDYDATHLRKDITLDVIIIQAKSGAGFQETPIERFITVSDDIFDLAVPVSKFGETYNPALCAAIARFRETYKILASRFPSLRITYFYACKGDQPEPNTLRKAEKLVTSVKGRFSSAVVDVVFLGSQELLSLARRSAKTTFSLALAENPVSSSGEVGFVALVYLRDYFAFITDDRKQLRRQLFEANVRDYQGRTEVNEEIQKALITKGGEDFWWLNNGVTIVASKASLSAKELTIADPQIVNGLQSSTEIFNYYTSANTANDQRKLLVRVIVPSDSASRDRIIKATNSQTAIQQASLRATDKIHRDIEEYLKPRGLYYDRRKNFYRNEGKPVDKVIGIPQLAQGVMAIVLARPDQARARPSSLLKDDADYLSVYSEKYPIELYFVVASIMKRVEGLLRAEALSLPAREVNNLKFYVAMLSTYIVAEAWRPTPKAISQLDLALLTDEKLVAVFAVVYKRYFTLGQTDQVAKGPQLLGVLNAEFDSGAVQLLVNAKP